MIEKIFALFASVIMFLGSFFAGSSAGSSTPPAKEEPKPAVEASIYTQLPADVRLITEEDHETIRTGTWVAAGHPQVSMTFGPYWMNDEERTPDKVLDEAFPDNLIPEDLQLWTAVTKCNDVISGAYFEGEPTITILRADPVAAETCTEEEKAVDAQMQEMFLSTPQVYLGADNTIYLKSEKGTVAFTR